MLPPGIGLLEAERDPLQFCAASILAVRKLIYFQIKNLPTILSASSGIMKHTVHFQSENMLHTCPYSNLIFGIFSGKLAITRLVPVNTLSQSFMWYRNARHREPGRSEGTKQIGGGSLCFGVRLQSSYGDHFYNDKNVQSVLKNEHGKNWAYATPLSLIPVSVCHHRDC